MTDFSTFLAKLQIFKALVLKDSISPNHLGSLIEELCDLIQQIDAETHSHGVAGKKLADQLAQETQTRKDNDDALQSLIDTLRAEFEALIGDNATEAIDNFNEIMVFLEGLTDSETLAAKLAELRLECTANKTEMLQKLSEEATARETADTALGGRLDIVEAKTSDTVICSGFLTATAEPTKSGTYIRRDAEGDPVMIVTLDDTGTSTEYPQHGKTYVCEGIGYIFDGIMLVPVGHRRMVLDGGIPATRTNFHLQINGGTPATRASILKQIDGGTPRKR